MKQNRLVRWFKRNDLESTERKMKEWGIYDYEIFFMKIFHNPLTEEEKLMLHHLKSSHKTFKKNTY